MYKATRRFFALAAALAIAALPAFGFASTLVRGIGSEPESFDPHKAVGTSASVVIYDLFEGLVVAFLQHLLPSESARQRLQKGAIGPRARRR